MKFLISFHKSPVTPKPTILCQRALTCPKILYALQELDWHQKLCIFYEQLPVTDLLKKISFNTVELTVVCQITSYFKVSNGLCVWNSRGGWKIYQKLIVGGGGGGTVGGGKYWEF